MQNTQTNKFENLDFGTVISTGKLERIEVQIDPEMVVKDYSDAFVKELRRRNPQRFQAEEITADDMYTYSCGLLKIRVESVENNCPNWRRAKGLYIPAWIQFAISRIGESSDRKRGLQFVPVFNYSYDLDWMLAFSDSLAAYADDGVALFQDAFPRDREGNLDTMSLAVINDYVKGQSQVQPVNSYIAAFLGFTLAKDTAFDVLYRVRYDDIDFIHDQLIHTKELF